MFEFRVSYSQRYLFNAIPDTNHNANPTNPTNPTNTNTRYRCEYGNLNSNTAIFWYGVTETESRLHDSNLLWNIRVLAGTGPFSHHMIIRRVRVGSELKLG